MAGLAAAGLAVLTACGSGETSEVGETEWPSRPAEVRTLLEELPTQLTTDDATAKRSDVESSPKGSVPLTTVSYHVGDGDQVAHVAVSHAVTDPGPAATLFGELVWVGVPSQPCSDFEGSPEIREATETPPSQLERAYAQLAEVDPDASAWFECTVTLDAATGEELPEEQWEYLAGWTATTAVYTVSSVDPVLREDITASLTEAATTTE